MRTVLAARLAVAIVVGAALTIVLPTAASSKVRERGSAVAGASIRIHVGGVGGSIRIDPTPTSTTCSSEDCVYELTEGMPVRLVASVADSGSRFVRWVGSCERVLENRCYLSAHGEQSVGAFFTPLYLGLVADGNGSLSVSRKGELCAPSSKTCEHYAYGVPVVVRAHPAAGERLVEWLGDCRGSHGITCRLAMTDDREAIADFTGAPSMLPAERRTEFSLSLTGTGTGKVNVRIGAKSRSCESDEPMPCSWKPLRGAPITLEAVPTNGSTFEGWKHRCKGKSTCQLVNVHDSKGRPPSVKASFSP